MVFYIEYEKDGKQVIEFGDDSYKLKAKLDKVKSKGGEI